MHAPRPLQGLATAFHRPVATRQRQSRGQVLVVTAFAFVAFIAMAALVIDGGLALDRRRMLQNAGDAAALAAANQIKASGTSRGCSDTPGPPPGAPRADVVQAALDSLAANLPGFDPANAAITCPDGNDNDAVRVALTHEARTLFASVIGATEARVSTVSSAINGAIFGTTYSVVLLNPHNPSWPQARRGCPSLLFSGGPTVTLEGSIQVNSACSEANGGALSTNGGAASVTVTNGAVLRLVGEYKPQALTISPPPLEGQSPVKDPLAGLPPMDLAEMPTRRSSRWVINGGTQVLEPGIYNGGIELRSTATVYMRPGIYVIRGGGLRVSAGSKLYTIPASLSSTSDATWQTDCPRTTCGVLIHNIANAAGSMGQVSVEANATARLRSYYPDADPLSSEYPDYLNLLLWQHADPVPTATYEQPIVQLNGGGDVTLTGTVYAPSAKVQMGGGSGGSGGTVNITLQFISWDLELSGNANFTFYYRDADFTKPTGYGLIE